MRTSRSWMLTPRLIAFAILLSAALLGTQATAWATPRLGDLKPRARSAPFALGVFEPRGQDMLVSSKHYGMPHTDVWMDAFFYDQLEVLHVNATHAERNDKGNFEAFPHGRFQIPLIGQPAGVAMAPDPFFKPWHGELTEELLPDNHVRRTVQTTPSVTEQVTYGPKYFEWKSSDGQVDITGTTTTPGMNYYLPTPLEAEASGQKIDDPRIYDMYYGQLYYFVDGTYYGNEVKGGVVIELMWGFTPYHDTWWVSNRIGHWANWITEYADGTQEYGGVFCASDGARGVVVGSSTGEVVNTNEVNAVVTDKDAAASPLHIDYDFSGSGRWEWTGEPNGVLLPQSAPTGSLSLGTIHRVNEPREIVKESGVQLISGKGNCRTEHLTPAGLRVRTRRPSPRRPRRLKVQLVPSGAVLHNLRVTVKRRRRTIKTVTLDRLFEPQTLTIKTRRRLRRGRYTVVADASELDAVSTRLRVRGRRLKARR